MTTLKRISIGAAASATLALTSTPALARVGEETVGYWGKLMELGILAFNSLLFLASLVVLLVGGWFLIRDYVLAKSDHEKAFTPGKLGIALIVAGLFAYPSGAFLLGTDLTTGDATTVEVQASDFERAPNG